MSQKEGGQLQDKLRKFLFVTYAMRRGSYLVRALAGGYLVCATYQMVDGSVKSGEPLTPFLIAAGVFMIIISIYFLLGAGYALLKGIYAENDPEALQETPFSEDDEAESVLETENVSEEPVMETVTESVEDIAEDGE